jgi:2,3-bisphosphoglycerate-independent phosphoglycerate mutase
MTSPAGGRQRVEFHAGVSYRNLLVLRGIDGDGLASTRTQAPHDIPDRPIIDHLPQGWGAALLNPMMDRSREILRNHPVNRARIAAGKLPATQIWLWGQGRAPHLRPFFEAYGERGAIVSAVDLVRGVGVLLGWSRVDVPGATGYLDTDYAAKGRYAIDALDKHDLVCVHVEAPDEASHEGRVDAKVEAIEQVDRHIVGPLLEALPRHGDWRMLVEPDHRTMLRTRAHAYGEVPFVIAGAGVEPLGQMAFDEVVAADSPEAHARGHELMGRFLR